MSGAIYGEAFITHEYDEAIAIQRALVKAAEALAGDHPHAASRQTIQASLADDRAFLRQLERLGKRRGATGKAEDVAESMQTLMEKTASKASDAESEAYEAHAVLLSLKRKQQDSGAAMLKIARAHKDTEARDVALEFSRQIKVSAKALGDALADFAVVIAGRTKAPAS